MKSSLKFFFMAAFVLLTLGVICELAWHSLVDYVLPPDNSSSGRNPPYDLALADYHLSSGAVDIALDEYKTIVGTSQPPTRTVAELRLNRIWSLQQSFWGRLSYITLQILWKTYPRFYAISGLLILTWAGILIFKQINKRASFALLPILNSTDIHGVNELSTLVIERLHEIHWRTREITRTVDRLICEQLEIPNIGLANDGKNINIDKVLETAWAIASGNSNLSLAELIKSLRLWINTPKYIVSGSLLENDQNIQLRLFMQQGDTGNLAETWQFNLPPTSKHAAVSIFVDDITFVLLHYFSKSVSTRNWRALEASTKGILYFELYFTDKQTAWLEAARTSFETAMVIDPDYMVARYNLGLVFLSMGQFDAARTILKPITLK